MTLIEAKVVDQTLAVTKKPAVASGGINETSILFSFCPNWDTFLKTAVFTDAKKENWYDVVIDADGKAVVPAQVTAEKGRFWFGVVGFKDQTRYTTQIVQYDVAEGAALSGEDAEIPESVVNQIMAAIDDTNKAVSKLGERVKTLEDDDSSAETPVFDLAALGLPAVPYGGTEAVSVETDTTEIMEALGNGVVIFELNVSIMGNVFPVSVTANALYMNGGYSWLLPQPQENGFITFTLNVTEGVITAQIPFTPIETADTPIFDLVSLGLPDIPYGAEEGVVLDTDTTEIMSALAKGAVSFKVNLALGEEAAPLTVTVNPITTDGIGMCFAYASMLSELDVIMFQIFQSDGENGIIALAKPIQLGSSEKVATSIDMSSFDTNGQIVETYADGSTKTSTIEFDTDGNPIKITDGNGNVTTLTW